MKMRIVNFLFLPLLLFLAGCALPFQAELSYGQTMLNHVQRTSTSVTTLQALLLEPQLGDATWEGQVNEQITAQRALIAEARALTPPEQFASMHQTYLGAMQSLEDMGKTYEQAVALRDNALLQQATQLLNQGTAVITQVQQQLGGGQ
ncbi:MAG: hypothetical protein MUD01_21820 [Chloroflexaceae bacterium]|jgi:hypothetical protein|nr:hypothetical protein [Chloroflexaceae bacterium]